MADEAVVPNKREKVCIVGCSDSKNQAPYGDNTFEFWGVNNLFTAQDCKMFTRWFEIHMITNENGKWFRRGKPDFRGMPVEQYLDMLSKLKIPVYMGQTNPFVPNSVAMPFQQLVQQFGGYFTNTISWEIALAIIEGMKEIRIYGVDMAVDTEYFWQRPSCEYFLGIAVGRGIKVWLPDTCDLLKSRFLYGAQEPLEIPWRAKMAEMQKNMNIRKAKAVQEKEMAQRKEFEYNGAIAAVAEIDKIWKAVTGG